MNRDEKKKYIYELMTGAYDTTVIPEEMRTLVKNEMAPDRDCDKLYAEIYEANKRICERLGTQDDEDVEIIISRFWEMIRQLSMQMFAYGADEALLQRLEDVDLPDFT